MNSCVSIFGVPVLRLDRIDEDKKGKQFFQTFNSKPSITKTSSPYIFLFIKYYEVKENSSILIH